MSSNLFQHPDICLFRSSLKCRQKALKWAEMGHYDLGLSGMGGGNYELFYEFPAISFLFDFPAVFITFTIILLPVNYENKVVGLPDAIGVGQLFIGGGWAGC